MKDADIILSYIGGNEYAFDVLYRKYRTMLYITIVKIIKDVDLAEDLIHDTFIKAFKTINLGKYKEKESFSFWINRIAYNLAIDSYRRQQRYPHSSLGAVGDPVDKPVPSTEELQIIQDRHTELNKSIQKLPKLQKEIVIMRYWKNMRFKVIAEELDISVNTALARMRYAIIKLRKYEA